MKCQEVSHALEEYFDGELNETQSRAVAAHLGTCQACAASYGALEREQEFLSRYERDVEVTPQLWHGIAARIAAENAEPQTASAPLGTRLRTWLSSTFTVPRFSPALTAALVLVAVALTVGAMKLMQPRNVQTAAQPMPNQPIAQPTGQQQQAIASPQPSVEPATPEQHKQEIAVDDQNKLKPRRSVTPKDERRTLPTNEGGQFVAVNQSAQQPKREPSPDDLVRDAEAKYQKAIAILSRDVNTRRPTLDAVTLARYDDTLKALDRTIAETRRAALGRGNNDPVAVQYMLTAYEKKVEVLREMARN
jgi:anti-sigma factor RsiW